MYDQHYEEEGAIEPERNSEPKSEMSKQWFRVLTWKKIKNSRNGIGFIFNRNPSFVGIEKAVAKLCDTDEFHMARNIKVGADRVLYDLMIMTMEVGKTLYVNGLRETMSLYNRVEMPIEIPEEVKRDVLGARTAMHKYLTAVEIQDRAPFDMIVIASLLVSRQGQRIGRGKGTTDMEIGLLIELGVVTPNTWIVTLVHDMQVVENLPADIFKKFDIPVDLIVTPSQLIRVTDAPPRPSGIYWEMINQRHLRAFPALKRYKDQLEDGGKNIVLCNLHDKSENQLTEIHGDSVGHAVTERPPTGNQQRRRRYRNKRRRGNKTGNRPTASATGSSQSSPPSERQDTASGKKVTIKSNDTKPARRRSRPLRDFCVKLSNLTCDVRIKDVKSELRRRNCNPLSILWIGRLGKCYLHFGNRTGKRSTQDDIDKVMTAMSGLSLTIKEELDGDGIANNKKPQGEPKADGGTSADGDTNGNVVVATDTNTAGSAHIKVINVSVELMKHNRDGEQEAVKPTKMKAALKKN